MPLKLANKQKKDSGSDSASGRKYRKFPRVLDSFIQLIKTVISFSTMYMCNIFFIKVPIIPKYLMQSFCLTRRIELMLKMCTSVTSCLIYNPFKKNKPVPLQYVVMFVRGTAFPWSSVKLNFIFFWSSKCARRLYCLIIHYLIHYTPWDKRFRPEQSMVILCFSHFQIITSATSASHQRSWHRSC